MTLSWIIFILIVSSMLCAGISIAGTSFYMKAFPTELERQITELNKEDLKSKEKIKYYEHTIDVLERNQNSLKLQRDDYAKIASTHNPPKSKKRREESENINLIYFSDAQSNIENFKKDLEVYGNGATFSISSQILVSGEIKKELLKKGWNWNSNDLNKFNVESSHTSAHLKLSGSAEKICKELESVLKDPAWDLATKDGKWMFPTYPIKLAFAVHATFSKEEEKEIPIQIVEVLKIQKEIQIVEIEKPVYLESAPPTEFKKADSRDLDELIAAKIEVELELRDKGRTMKKVTEG